MFEASLAAAMASALVAARCAGIRPGRHRKEDDTKKAKKTASAEKELSAQQQKMKDCARKWGDYKKEKNVKGRAEYRKFMSTCLKA